MSDIGDELNKITHGIANSMDSAEMLSYIIWGAVVTTTRAFETVTLKVDGNTSRIFVSIRLRWFVKYKRFKPLRDVWLKRAEQRCKEHVPEGWRLLVYYEGGNK